MQHKNAATTKSDRRGHGWYQDEHIPYLRLLFRCFDKLFTVAFREDSREHATSLSMIQTWPSLGRVQRTMVTSHVFQSAGAV